MKRIGYIVALICACSMVQGISAQAPTRQRPSQQQQTPQSAALPELSVRAKSMNEDQTKNTDNVPWLREIYRMVNLKEEANAPLYYPVEPIGDRMNLFTAIFKLLSDDKIVAYEYEDGKEVFIDKNKVKFKDILDRFYILYKEQKSGANTKYVVEDVDIPSGEVLSYLVKEAWYFDPSNSTFDVKLLAICPLLVREGDFGEMNRQPLFWLPYENIRPYISQKPIMTSNINNAMTYTMDDYFRKRMFKGEIIKTTNLLNYTLAQQFGDNPDTLKMAQDSIEKQLKLFEQKLWIEPDTAKVVSSKDKKKDDNKSSSKGSTREPKQQKIKSESSSPSPSRSVRRTR